MAKVSIDLDYVKDSLSNIGYIISDCIERENNGINWQLKFSNSGACVTIYDTNTKKNTVVNGKCEDGEAGKLKAITDSLKCKELTIDPLNKKVVELINSKREDFYYDFKQQWYIRGKEGSFLHDLLCLVNNVEGQDAYLIIGVSDHFEPVGVEDWRKSNEIFDFLRSIPFAGGQKPDVELKKVYYKYHKIDLLWIKQSKNVPFFLNEPHKGVGIQIYTRTGDTNTPINKAASYGDIEKLWRLHFLRKNEN